MGERTEISWTDHTFNPWWGCTRVSPGCENCYAETFARRLGLKVWGTRAEHRRFGDKHWNEPVKWNRDALKAGVRHRVFCASMADVFEGRAEDAADRERLWSLIEATPALDWQLLTKRPQNMIRLAPASWANGWPRNVWTGCTVEDQQRADERSPELRKVPAAIRFLSAEPLLGDLHFDDGIPGIDWIIVGGESGHGARPFDLAWARSIIWQAKQSDAVVFVKQFGANPIMGALNKRAAGITDSKGGDMSEWPADLRVRDFPR